MFALLARKQLSLETHETVTRDQGGIKISTRRNGKKARLWRAGHAPLVPLAIGRSATLRGIRRGHGFSAAGAPSKLSAARDARRRSDAGGVGGDRTSAVGRERAGAGQPRQRHRGHHLVVLRE